jgi:hypothetical protein
MAKSKKKAPPRSKARKASPARRKAARKPAKRAKKVAKANKAAKKAQKGSRKTARATAAKKGAAARTKRLAKKSVKKSSVAGKSSAASKTVPKRPAAKAAERRAGPPRRPPALDRERRTIREDDVLPTPPSSLNMDRSASSARTGRHELAEKLRQHTSTGPALTGGDVDADWEDAEAVGDEAPGGDNPTPDQDIVEEIGEAMGVTYHDNEELQGGDEISERDRHRWELDPASREDYNEED